MSSSSDCSSSFSKWEKVEDRTFLVLFRLVSGNAYRNTVSAVLVIINFFQLLGFVLNPAFDWCLPDSLRNFFRFWQLSVGSITLEQYPNYFWPCILVLFLAVGDVVVVGVYAQSGILFPTKFLRIVCCRGVARSRGDAWWRLAWHMGAHSGSGTCGRS